MKTMIRAIRTLPILAFALALAACDDPTGVEEHLDPAGIAILMEGTEIARYMLNDAEEPSLTIAQGTHELVIRLLDDDGEPLPEPDDDDHEHALLVAPEDTSILTWEAEDHAHEGEVIEFHGELTAHQPGSTPLLFCVPHGSHCDFDLEVAVTVTAP